MKSHIITTYAHTDIPEQLSRGLVKHVFVRRPAARRMKINTTLVVMMDALRLSRGDGTVTDLKALQMSLADGMLQVYDGTERWPKGRTERLVLNSGLVSEGQFLEYLSASCGITLGTRKKTVYMVCLDGFHYSPMMLLCRNCAATKAVEAGSILNGDGTVLDADRHFVFCRCACGLFHEFGAGFVFDPSLMGNRNVRLSNTLFEEMSVGKRFEAFMYFNVPRGEMGPFRGAVRQDPGRRNGTVTMRRKTVVGDASLDRSTFDTMMLVTGMGTFPVFKEQFRKLYRRIYGRTKPILEDRLTNKFINNDINFINK